MTAKPPSNRFAASDDEASPWKPLETRHEERAAKHQAVLRAAMRLFLERGFNKASMRELAERLNITKPALYNYFSSKEEILKQCIDLNHEMTNEAFATAEAHPGNGMDRLRVFLERYVAVSTLERGAFVNRIDDRELQDDVRDHFRAIKRGIDRRVRDLVEAGIADGSIAPCDVRLTTFMFMGAIQWISQWYRPDGPQTSDEIAREYAERLVNGLATRPA